MRCYRGDSFWRQVTLPSSIHSRAEQARHARRYTRALHAAPQAGLDQTGCIRLENIIEVLPALSICVNMFASRVPKHTQLGKALLFP